MTNSVLDNKTIGNIVKVLNDTGYEVFDLEIKRDEVEAHDAFFIYTIGNNIRKGERSYLVDVEIVFLSKKGETINEIELAEKLKRCGLVFNWSNLEVGKIDDTEKSVTLCTLNFHKPLKVCC